MRENHPDSLIARGVPEEFIKLANDKLAAINTAYDKNPRRTGPEVKRVECPSPNQDERGGAQIDMLVLHYTGMQSGGGGAGAALRSGAPRSRRITPSTRTARSMRMCRRRAAPGMPAFPIWAGARDVNARSIGIELVNPGHEFGYRAFPEAQIAALIALCQGILARHPISPARVLGHSDVAPARKDDPGELFPWQRLAGEGIGLWPVAAADPGADAVSGLLMQYGYDPEASPEKVVTAFQRHFRSSCVDGMADAETRAVLSGLIALYDAEKEVRA